MSSYDVADWTEDTEQAQALIEWDESNKRGCAHWLVAVLLLPLLAACATNPNMSDGDLALFVLVTLGAIALVMMMGTKR